MNDTEIFPALRFEQFEDEFEDERGRIGGARAPLRRAPPRARARTAPRPRPKARARLKPGPRPRPRPQPLPPSWPPHGAGYVLPLGVTLGGASAPSGDGRDVASGGAADDARWPCVQACFNRAAPAPGGAAAAPDGASTGGDAPDGAAAAPAPEPAPGEYELEFEDESLFETGAAAATDCRIIDLTSQAEHSHRKGKRDPKSVYALVLHQMACCYRRRDPLRSYLRTKAHFVILPEGQILQLHPVSALLWASHGFNSKSVAVEFAGNFPNVKGRWWKGETYGRDRPTPAQLEAGRCLVRHLVRTIGLRVVLAHRQSSNMRENDPGPEVWFHVGQWAVDTLGLSDGGSGFKIGNGKPILDAWRTWGRAVGSTAPELEDEYEYEYEDEAVYRYADAGEGELEASAGLMTLPAAIADTRADGPGIYTLFKDGRRVYVGRSKELRRRLQQHLLCLTHLKLTASRFRVKLTPLRGAAPGQIGRVESAVIGRFGRAAQGGPLANVKSREF